MFRLIKVVLNGFVSAPLKIVQPKTHHVESCFYCFLYMFIQKGGLEILK